jgi:hypothetical protein
LSELEQEWGEWYTLGGVSRLLETLGLSYTRTSYTWKRSTTFLDNMESLIIKRDPVLNNYDGFFD